MNTKHITITILLALLIGACAPKGTPVPTVDIGAIQTAAAQTVIARITEDAVVIPPTPLASPTITLTLTTTTTPGILGTPVYEDSNYDDATVDVNIPNNTVMTPGQEFLKTWKIRNTGIYAWGPGYSLIFAYGEKMSGLPAALTSTIVAGQEVEVSVQFKAPTKAGQYTSTWRMANPSGSAFGEFFYVLIIVR